MVISDEEKKLRRVRVLRGLQKLNDRLDDHAEEFKEEFLALREQKITAKDWAAFTYLQQMMLDRKLDIIIKALTEQGD